MPIVVVVHDELASLEDGGQHYHKQSGNSRRSLQGGQNV